MKAKLTFLSVLLLVLLCAPAFAQYATPPAADAGPAAAEPVNVGNKFCPISGKPIGTMGETKVVEYKGKAYNLCCPMCEKDFNADPEKYIKILEETK